MRKSIFSFFNLSCLLLLTGLFVSCKDFNDLSTLIQEEDSSLFLKDDLRATSSFSDCLESYPVDKWPIITYRCPIDEYQLNINKVDFELHEWMKTVIESRPKLYLFGRSTYEEMLHDEVLNRKKIELNLPFNLPRHGSQIQSIHDELAGAPNTATVTLYVLEQGFLHGFVALGIQSGGQYSRAITFYPNSSLIFKDQQYSARYFDVSGLAYTHSVTLEDVFIPGLLQYLALQNQNFYYPGFQAFHLFQEAFRRSALLFPPSQSSPPWANGQTGVLASSIRSWNPPARVKINRNGGFIPQRVGEGGGEVIFP